MFTPLSPSDQCNAAHYWRSLTHRGGGLFRSWRLLLPVFLLCSCICPGVAAEPPKDAPDLALKSYSETSDKLEVSVALPAKPTTLPTFQFEITFKNLRSGTIIFLDVESRPVCVISVFTEAGRECKRTASGEYANGPDFVGSWGTGRVSLPPGKSHSWRIPLRDIFVLEPGKYQMTVGFACDHDGTPGRWKTKGMPFVIAQ